jgi:hypothetical protein
MGDSWQLLGTISTHGWLCLWHGDLTQAALDLDEAAELALRVGDEHRIANALAHAAEVLTAFGEHNAAIPAVRSLSHWSLTHRTNSDSVIALTVARHDSWLASDLPDAVANPIRVQLRATIDAMNTTDGTVTSEALTTNRA